jgi:hypothetical protein
MTGLTLFQQGSFTSDGNGRRIDLPGGADYFVVENQTELAATNDVNFRFTWNPLLNESEANVTLKTGGVNTTQETLDTSDNFIYREAVPGPEAAVAATAITAANPAVVTAASHGYAVGDRVRMVNPTVMDQIAGMDFSVTAVGGVNNFTLGNLDASGFAAAETGCNFRRLPQDVEVLPGAFYITNITAATSAVVTFSVNHNYKVGDVLYFRVPSDFGMVEMDGLEGKVTAVATATVTVDINSSGFTAFAFPLAADVPQKFALAGLAGKRGLYDDWFSSSRSLLDLNPFRDGLFVPYMWLPGGQGNPGGANNDVVLWQAYRSA